MYKVAIYCHELYAGDLFWGFTAAGCEVQIIKPTSTEDFDRLMGEIDPDLLLLSSCMDYFTLPMLAHIGSRNSPRYQCVIWDTEGVGQLNLQKRGFDLSKPDMIFSICPEMLDVLKSNGIPCERLDFAYNPTIHYPKSVSANEAGAISLVGNAWLWYSKFNPAHYRYRVAIPVLLKPLIENDYKVDFYGTTEYKQVIKNILDLDVPIEWFKGSVSYARTCDVYNNSFVNLITQNHERTITRRTFEILGSGGFGLSCYNTAVKEMFGNSGGLAIANMPEDTLELVEYYKKNLDQYLEVRKKAVESVQKHTYKERAEQVIDQVLKKEK